MACVLGGGVFIVPGVVIFAHMPMHVAIGASLSVSERRPMVLMARVGVSCKCCWHHIVLRRRSSSLWSRLDVAAGLMSALLEVGAGALKVAAMDYLMRLPLKVSSTTSNFMIGVTAGASAFVFLARGDVSTAVTAPIALSVTAGALVGSRILPRVNVHALRLLFVAILLMIAAEMAWLALSGI